SRERAHHTALLLTIGLMGCWHGLELPYLVYGLYQGAMLVPYDVAGRWSERRGLALDAAWVRPASVFLTVNLFCFGLLIFSGRLFQAAARCPAGSRSRLELGSRVSRFRARRYRVRATRPWTGEESSMAARRYVEPGLIDRLFNGAVAALTRAGVSVY